MKILKWLVVVLGIAALVAAGYYTYRGWLDLRNLVAIAESLRSIPQVNPQPQLMAGIGLALLAGLLLGAGLVMPRRTANRIRNETLQSVAVAREADIRSRALGTPAESSEPPHRTEEGGTDGHPR